LNQSSVNIIPFIFILIITSLINLVFINYTNGGDKFSPGIIFLKYLTSKDLQRLDATNWPYIFTNNIFFF